MFSCWCNGTQAKHNQSERTTSNDTTPPCAEYHQKNMRLERVFKKKHKKNLNISGGSFHLLLNVAIARKITLSRIWFNLYLTFFYFTIDYLKKLPSVTLVEGLPEDHWSLFQLEANELWQAHSWTPKRIPPNPINSQGLCFNKASVLTLLSRSFWGLFWCIRSTSI